MTRTLPTPTASSTDRSVDLGIPEVLDKAADLLERHGLFPEDFWPRSEMVWNGRDPVDITGAIGLARGYVCGGQVAKYVADSDKPLELCDPAFYELAAHLDLQTPLELFAWSDARADEGAWMYVALVLRELAGDLRTREVA